MTTLEKRIEALEAKDEIRELTARYCHAVVDGDVEAIVRLFCRDGVFRMRRKVVSGRDELRAFYGGGVSGQTHKPFIQNNVVALDGDDEADGRCSVEIRIVEAGVPYTCAGHYLDRYRREEGQWRFANRHFNAYHYVPLREGWTR